MARPYLRESSLFQIILHELADHAGDSKSGSGKFDCQVHMIDLDDIGKLDLMRGKKGIRMLPGNIFPVKHDKGGFVQKIRLIKEISSIFAVKGGEIGIGSHENIFDGFEGQAGNRAAPVILQMSQADQPDINGSLLQGGNRAGGGLAGDGDLDIGIFRDKGSKKRQKHVLAESGTDPDGQTAYLLGYEGPYLILPGFEDVSACST